MATLAVRGPGDSFGEMALVADDARRSATVAALEEAETYAVYQAEFHRLREEHPQVNQVLIAFLATEVRRQNELLLEALYVPVERRVLRRLLELVGSYENRAGEIPLTQEQLAELAGTSRATMNKVLQESSSAGRWSCTAAERSCSTQTRSRDALAEPVRAGVARSFRRAAASLSLPIGSCAPIGWRRDASASFGHGHVVVHRY